MIFHSLRLENAKVFDNVFLNLNNQGLVFVGGDNGSGKSTLLKLLKRTLFGKQTTASPLLAKDPKKGYLSEVIFETNHKYKIIEARNHKIHGTGTKLFKMENDWVDITAKNQAGKRNDREQILSLLGFDKLTYDGLVYLAQESDHVLIYGKPAEIKTWIGNLFNLGIYDDALDLVKMKITNLMDYEKDYITKEAIKNSLSYDKEEHDKTIKELNSFKDILMALKDIQHMLQLKKTSFNQKEGLINLAKDLEEQLSKLIPLDLEQISNDMVSTRTSIHNLEQVLKIKNALIPYENDTKIKDGVAEKHNKLFDDIKLQQSKYQEYFKLQTKLNKIKIIEKPNPFISFLDRESNEEELLTLDTEYNTSIYLKQKDLKDLTKVEGICPLCKQVVPDKTDAIKELKDYIQEYTSRRQEISKYRNTFHSYNEFYSKQQNLIKQLSHLQNYKIDLSSVISKYQDKSNLIRLKQKRWIEKENLLKQLTQFPSINLDQQDLINLKEKEKDLEKLYNQAIKYKARNDQKIDIDIKLAKLVGDPWTSKDDTKLEDTNIKLSEIDYKRGNLEAVLENILKTKKQLDMINSKIEIMMPKINHLYNIRKLQIALKLTKGIKVKNIILHISKRLHFYTGILFDKDSKFIVEDSKKGINIFWDKGGKMIPISEASGGEKKRISLAIIFTLQEILPYICNLLILDEVDLGLDSQGVDSLIELINIKKETIDTLILISHKPTIKQANFDKKYYISKVDEGTSKLEEQ